MKILKFRQSKEFQELFSSISQNSKIFTLQFLHFSKMLFSKFQEFREFRDFHEFRKFREFGELFSPISKK
jgi:hypothetical protein